MSASRKESEKQIADLRKRSKKNGDKALSNKALGDILTAKWMTFGGSFYSIVALWTFLVIEVQEALQFIATLPEFIQTNKSGVFDLAIMFIVNQAQTFGQAFAWVVYWGDDHHFSPAHLIVAYIAYLAGLKLAAIKSLNPTE